jgi:hypothetical protein
MVEITENPKSKTTNYLIITITTKKIVNKGYE